MSSPETALTALERAYANAVQVISTLPEAQRMYATDRLAEIAERHLGTATRMQQEEVLSSHSAHPLNFPALARGQIWAAREKQGCSPEEFAELLTNLVSWRISPDVLRAWERPAGASPPSDVLLAVQQLLGLTDTA